MSAHMGRVAALSRPAVTFESDVEASGSGLRNTRPRIHPALYVFAVVGGFVMLVLSIAALQGYSPPAHLPEHHDELFSVEHADHHRVDGDSQLMQGGATQVEKGGRNQVSTSWNNIASVLGGFSTTYVTSPQLNTSWIARPAGFGARITGGQGLVGKLEFMKMPKSVEVTEAPSTVDRTGCHTAQPIYSPPNSDKPGLPRVALIQRGDCQFLTKLLNAQAQGFDAAIVYNDYEHSRRQREDRGGEASPSSDDRDEDELISMWSPSRESAYLRIPSVFVSYRTGKILETLLAVEGDNLQDAIVILEPEDTPHFLLMDIIIALFFLPTVFTTVVLVVTRLRQIRHRAQQRAPQTLVDSLPTFQWREGLDLNLEALATEEKGRDASSAGPENTRTKSAGMDHRLAGFLSRALRRPVPAGEGVSGRHTVIPIRKARHIAKKIFQQKECAICLSDFSNGETIRLLPCGHLFHKDEIDSWLVEQKRWCPVCRFSVDGEDEDAVLGTSAPHEEARAGSTSPSATQVPAQPIIMPDDVAGFDLEEEQPVASSSTASERTPLLQTLSRSSDKS